MFNVFVSEHPHGKNAEGGCKAVAVGHGAVGVTDKHKGDARKNRRCGNCRRKNVPLWSVSDGGLGVGVFFSCPHHPAVNAGKEIVDVDAHVGVEFALEKDVDIYSGHEQPEEPEPFIGFVFQIEVDEPDDGADDFDGLHCFAQFGITCLEVWRWIGTPNLRHVKI